MKIIHNCKENSIHAILTASRKKKKKKEGGTCGTCLARGHDRLLEELCCTFLPWTGYLVGMKKKKMYSI